MSPAMRRVSRRRFLGTLSATPLAALFINGCGGDEGRAVAPDVERTAEPTKPPEPTSARFDAGVASGAITDGAAVLWTRINAAAIIRGQVSRNPDFTDIKAEAELTPLEEDGFTVHWFVNALSANRVYFYRFLADDGASPVGRLRTAPPREEEAPLRFAFSGDSDGTRDADGNAPYNDFEVLDAAAADDLSFFLYGGDTIYSDSPLAPEVARTTDEYRAKYLENRGYGATRNLLSRAPVFAMFDDHEFGNDFEGEDFDSERYAAGYRAYRDYWPAEGEPATWRSVTSPADAPPAYRSFRWGKLAEFYLVDARSFRSRDAGDQCRLPNGDLDFLPSLGREGVGPDLSGLRLVAGYPAQTGQDCLDLIASTERTVLGEAQLRWLKEGLEGSGATFKFVFTGQPIQQLFVNPYDRWEGYEAERRELLEFIGERRIRNVIFLSTDLHGNLINDVSPDMLQDLDPVAVEVVTGPIATHTFASKIAAAIGEDLVPAFKEFLGTAAGTRCLEIDVPSYALFDVTAEEAIVEIKNAEGEILYTETFAAT
ncbi:MAG: alkaline phosphatase D family protein [Dehalococcoidia bacterium]